MFENKSEKNTSHWRRADAVYPAKRGTEWMKAEHGMLDFYPWLEHCQLNARLIGFPFREHAVALPGCDRCRRKKKRMSEPAHQAVRLSPSKTDRECGWVSIPPVFGANA